MRISHWSSDVCSSDLIYALRQRLRGAAGSMAEAYGWGKVAGMVFPWIVDAGSRVAGVDVYSPEAFYIPWLYAMSDQMGANVAGFLHLWRKQGAATRAGARSHPQARKGAVSGTGVAISVN